MFDIGWSEILLIVVVASIVIGPRELPALLRILGRLARRLQYVRYAFTQQFEDFIKEHDLDSIHQDVNFEAHRGQDVFDESAFDEEHKNLKRVDHE
ncbi:MAG: Sec-independent protein translocase protein TatB [Alphaproteobacteria bacterium]|nr:Sec-independent protein translocase protein TatB [Alphaproteobacteria bacterium]